MTGLFPAVGDGEAPADAAGRPLCERSLNWNGSEPHCGAPAAVLTRAMCVHEHYGEGYACAGCLASLRSICGDGEWLCEVCANGPDPHDCPMPMRAAALVTESRP